MYKYSKNKPSDTCFCVNLAGPWCPDNLIKHYSGCFCEGVFLWMRLTLKSVVFKADCPPYCRHVLYN